MFLQNLWCHLPLMAMKLHTIYLHSDTQNSILALNLSRSPVLYSILISPSSFPAHMDRYTTLFFFVSYRWKPTHISVLNRRTVCEVILSQHASVSVVIQSALMFSIPYCYWKEETISKRSQVGPFSRNFIFSCLENRLQLTLGIHSHICAYERDVTERDESIRLTADLQLISMRSRLFKNFLLTTSELYKGHLKNKAE